MSGGTIAPLLMSGAVAHTYATWDPANKGSNVTLSGSNLILTGSGAGLGMGIATIGKSAGKWYWEVVYSSSLNDGNDTYGISLSTTTLSGASPGILDGGGGYGYYGATGATYHNTSATHTGLATYTTSVTLQVALDMDNGFLYFGKSNTWINSGDPTSGATGTGNVASGLSGTFYPGAGKQGSGNYSVSWTANFGATSFTYTPPSGYNSGMYV